MAKSSSQDELKTDIAKMTLDQRKQAVLTDTGLAQFFKDIPSTTKEVMAQVGFDTETQQKGFAIFLELTGTRLTLRKLEPFDYRDYMRCLHGNFLDELEMHNYRHRIGLSSDNHKKTLLKAADMMGVGQPGFFELLSVSINQSSMKQLTKEELDCFKLIKCIQLRINKRFEAIEEKTHQQFMRAR